MNWKVVNLFLVLVLLLAAVWLASAATYNWSGEGDGSSWASDQNWYGICGGPPCYPRTTNDNATIAGLCDACTIELSTETIDDLAILSEEVTFSGNGSVATLTVVRFAAGTEGTNVTVRFTGLAAIQN